MGLFKKTEYSLICKVFNEVLFIGRIPHFTVQIAEAVVQRCSVKKKFLKISQNSQENRASFLLKLQNF